MASEIGKLCTTTAMVPTPRLRGVETSANMSYNKAALLKLEHIILNGTYLTIFGHYDDYAHVKLRTKH
jgi:hypothetical protein